MTSRSGPRWTSPAQTSCVDEVTSALDSETEKRLLENLQHLTDRTVVIVTHRPAALEICDRVFTFSVCQGDGSPGTLVSGGRFS